MLFCFHKTSGTRPRLSTFLGLAGELPRVEKANGIVFVRSITPCGLRRGGGISVYCDSPADKELVTTAFCDLLLGMYELSCCP